jgi:hypothetical protein
MVSKGAKHVVLVSRSGAVTGRVKDLVEEVGALGANIVVRRCNVVNKPEVDDLIANGLQGLPPVRGVVHGTMVLRVRTGILHRRSRYHSICPLKKRRYPEHD